MIANLIAFSQGKPPDWLVYSPLPFLFLLMFTGLYTFFQPCLARRRAERA